jgi:hypothetical protein
MGLASNSDPGTGEKKNASFKPGDIVKSKLTDAKFTVLKVGTQQAEVRFNLNGDIQIMPLSSLELVRSKNMNFDTRENTNIKYDYNNPEHKALRDKVAKDMLGKKWSECSPMEMDRVLKEVEKTNNQNIGEKKNANQDEVAILKEITNWLNHSADEDEIVKRLMGKYRNLSRKECEKLYRKASDQWEV